MCELRQTLSYVWAEAGGGRLEKEKPNNETDLARLPLEQQTGGRREWAEARADGGGGGSAGSSTCWPGAQHWNHPPLSAQQVCWPLAAVGPSKQEIHTTRTII